MLLYSLYPLYLVITGSPIWKVRARPTGTRPVILEDLWFRLAGGLALAELLFISVVPVSSQWDPVWFILPGIAYLVGLWRALAPRVL
ncbi:MAG: hypothetical protein C4524_13375 [Candidatus Zixiibacteriota bacterium]|nr:MAG: hypothetical protein C4524_13375 [candidate division Zixibacteria bacterium]